MAFKQNKESNLKIQNKLSYGDYAENKCQTKVTTRTSMESKIAGEGDINVDDTKLKLHRNTTDSESAYEESFCSDDSEEESVLTNVTCPSSTNELPACCFTNSESIKKKQNSRNLNKFMSTSKICHDKSIVLEDRIKCLSLDAVQPNRNVTIRSTRKNMSFTNDEIMKIEHDNEILLRKIMTQQRTQKAKVQSTQSKLSSSAINRKKFQRKIEEENLFILRRLQQAKSCVLNSNKIAGYRSTHF